MLKLPIESWIDQQNFSPDIRLLFSDSIKCYKADAFRASLLFSYLGFLTIIKERLLSTKKPPLFEQPYWDNNILKQIQNDDKWEAAVYQATQTEAKVKQGVKERDAIFSISTGLRNEISYWKNRRNDCAHFKANEINNFHVESFWSFLRSNLSKITVEGGIASLLAKFALHYDATHTPAGKDVSPLVAEISASVDPLNLATFWDKLETIIDNSHYYGSETFNLIAEKVFTLNDARLTASLRDFIKNNARRLRYY